MPNIQKDQIASNPGKKGNKNPKSVPDIPKIHENKIENSIELPIKVQLVQKKAKQIQWIISYKWVNKAYKIWTTHMLR